jgi:hypothetical protein
MHTLQDLLPHTPALAITMSHEADQHRTPDGGTDGTGTTEGGAAHAHATPTTPSACSRHGSVCKDVYGAPPFLELLMRELGSFVNDTP